MMKNKHTKIGRIFGIQKLEKQNFIILHILYYYQKEGKDGMERNDEKKTI